jgi:hypothetical protein
MEMNMRSLIFDDYGIRNWVLPTGLVAFILLAFYGFYLIEQADSKEMQEQNCSQTGNQRQSFYMQYIYDAKGNIASMYPVFYMEFEYKCDDHNRWR